jgi:hypothetical protein
MFTWRVRDSFGLAVSCVKLPAAVAFPTDDRLLERLAESRRALPPNSIKALWRSRAHECPRAPSALRTQDGGARLRSTPDVSRAAIDRLPARSAHWALPPTVHIEDVYARSKVAVGRR